MAKKRTHQAICNLNLSRNITPDQYQSLVQEQLRQMMARKTAKMQKLEAVKNMTEEEKARLGINAMTKTFLDHAMRNGIEMTETEAREKVQPYADIVEQKKKLGVI